MTDILMGYAGNVNPNQPDPAGLCPTCGTLDNLTCSNSWHLTHNTVDPAGQDGLRERLTHLLGHCSDIDGHTCDYSFNNDEQMEQVLQLIAADRQHLLERIEAELPDLQRDYVKDRSYLNGLGDGWNEALDTAKGIIRKEFKGGTND